MNEPRAEETSELPAAAPAPVTFDALPLSDEMRRALADMGYVHPTPVQLAVWDPATRGRDAVVQARTGTGKTASFGLPIIDHIAKRTAPGVQALVLCPTRELALQVSAELEKLAAHKGLKILAIYGGAPMERQVSALESGVAVVVGTPGRVLDHIRRRTLSTSSIRLLVLDEADEMLSMGFERELTAIVDALPPTRQTLLFSATVPPDIERISRSRLKDPEFVTLSGDHIGALEINHFTYLVASDKIGALVNLIETEDPESAIVFCNTRDQTEAVAGALTQRGYEAAWLNGDLAQSDREKVMTATRAGKLRFLVATDVAARGIDISHLTHVINFDFPMDAETYVHRTGRTGRAGRTGTAISLVLPQDIGSLYLLRLVYKIRPVERVLPSKTELKTRAEADLVAMLAEGLLPKGTAEDDRALARRLLTHDQIEGILAGLLREYLGARPAAQDDASQARRQKRATVKRAERRPEPEPLRSQPAASSAAPAAPTPPVAVEPRAAAEAEPSLAVVSSEPAAPPLEQRARTRTRDERGRGGPRREERSRPERPQNDRPREAGSPDARAGGPRPAREYAAWSPPEEEGDDEPLLPARERRPAPPARQPTSSAASADGASNAAAPPGDFVELFVGVGRRDGARAQDLLKALVDAGIDKDHVRRIRVRDRHAFVAVLSADAARATAELNGRAIAGKSAVTVELARERSDDAKDELAPEG